MATEAVCMRGAVKIRICDRTCTTYSVGQHVHRGRYQSRLLSLVVMNKLFLPSHHLSEFCHICTVISVISCKKKKKFQLNRTDSKWFLPMEMDRRRSNNCFSKACRSLAFPLFCHCQFVLPFDMHVICIMHIWSTALILHPPLSSLSLSPSFP